MPQVEAFLDKVGTEIGISDWIVVDQAMIDKFAQATGDHQFIHVDPERAKATPFGGTIAHGFLSLSLMPMLMDMVPEMKVDAIRMGVNVGGSVKFTGPVRSGSRVRGRFKLLSLDRRRPTIWQQVIEFTLEVEDQKKPALVAEWTAQYFV
ncbi:MAG: MaoC family dehydratase [Sphingomonas sp.]